MTHAPTQELSDSSESLVFREAVYPLIGGCLLGASEGRVIDLDDLAPGETVDALTHVEDRAHSVRITEAQESSRDEQMHTVLMFPGFLQMTDLGSASNFHKAVAAKFRDSRIVSVATDGVGLASRPVSPLALLKPDFDTMAADRLAIGRAVAGSNPTTLVAVSMGSIIGLRMAQLNLAKSGAEKLELRQIINHSHAQVSPGRVIPDMLLSFPAHIADELRRECLKIPLPVFFHALGNLALWPKHVTSHTRSLMSMALGTPLNRMQEVAAEIPTAYLSGTRDPLAQWDVLDTLQTGQPGNVHVVRRPDLGHLATVHARQEAGRVHDAHLQLLGVA